MSVSGTIMALQFALAVSFGAYLFGHIQGLEDGKEAQRGKQNAALVENLTGIVDAHRALIDESNLASKTMRNAVNARKKLDAATTKELKNALADTADKRADCRFNDDIMRRLFTRRGRVGDWCVWHQYFFSKQD